MIEEDAAAAIDLRLTVNAEGVQIGRLHGVARRIENPGVQGEVHLGGVYHLVVEDSREMDHPRAGDVVDLGLQNLP